MRLYLTSFAYNNFKEGKQTMGSVVKVANSKKVEVKETEVIEELKVMGKGIYLIKKQEIK